MGNLDNENTTFEAHLMSLRFKDRDKSYDKNSQGLQVIQPGKIEETNGNGPVQPNLQTEITVFTADENIDIPMLSEEQVNTMRENRSKYRARVHYKGKDAIVLDENEDR